MRKPLEKELKSYREQGISLYLNGILSNPKTIAKACQIAEGGGYMRCLLYTSPSPRDA